VAQFLCLVGGHSGFNPECRASYDEVVMTVLSPAAGNCYGFISQGRVIPFVPLRQRKRTISTQRMMFAMNDYTKTINEGQWLQGNDRDSG